MVMQAKVLNTRKPQVTGINVLLYNWPIAVPITNAIIEETEPIIAAAIPATCPIGSIAIALVLPKINPKQKKINPANIRNIHL